MDPFSIPEQMDPLARTENRGRNSTNAERRRRANPPPPTRLDDTDSAAEDEDEDNIHNLDERV